MNSFCIATWNLNNLSLKSDRVNLCRAKMAEIQADVWILTETREGFDPGKDFRLVAASDVADDRHWTAIWAHHSLVGSKKCTRDPKRAACAQIEIPGGFHLYIYGTVLPWRGSTWREFSSAGGRAFSEALAVQKKDWAEIRRYDPETLLCVAGDFNQDLLVSGHYYGSKKERELLEEAFEQMNLSCVTAGKSDPVAKLAPEKATVDHICLGGTRPLISEVKVNAWSPQQQERLLSDHYGVSVRFSYS